MLRPTVRSALAPKRQTVWRRCFPSPKSWIILFLCVATPIILRAEFTWLRARQQARSVAWANDTVTEKIALARAHLAEQKWNEAIRQLEDALAVDQASNREEARSLLEEVQRGQAESLLKMAREALARQQTENAHHWLEAYLAHSHAQNVEEARLLRADLERAVSDEEAARVLARLSDAELSVFQKDGHLTVRDGLHSLATRAIFQQTLRRNVPRELKQRQAQREADRLARQLHAAEHARHVARLRQTRAFQSLTAFVSQTLSLTSAQQQATRQQEVELQVLFAELNVNDPAERAEIRANLTGGDDRLSPRQSAERKRTEVKRAYRDSDEFASADRALFDQLVDEEVDRLLKLLPAS
jgi:hypothetical protein